MDGARVSNPKNSSVSVGRANLLHSASLVDETYG